MQKVIKMAILIFLLAACNQNPNPTTGDPQAGGDGIGAESTAVPTVFIEPTPTIPSTFTPAPMVHGGHLYLVNGMSGEYLVHVVQYGETLAILCHTYGVSVEQIARVNKLRNWNHIEVGQHLRIPVPITDETS